MILVFGWMLLLGAAADKGSDDAVTLAFRDLYQVASELTADPSNGYEPDAPNNKWPYATSVQEKWTSAVTANGTSLTPLERERMVPCGARLNNAINAMERGYTMKIGQAGNAGVQRSADTLYEQARAEFALCDKAYALGTTDSLSSAGRPLIGGVQETAPLDPMSPLKGSAEEAAQPGSIDWTPYLDPLFTFMGNEWQRKTAWYAKSTEVDTVTVIVGRNQPPVVTANTGSKGWILDDIVKRAPTPIFPPGSTLNALELVTRFYVGTSSTDKLQRTRRTYYERNGVFKYYLTAPPG